MNLILTSKFKFSFWGLETKNTAHISLVYNVWNRTLSWNWTY